MRKAKDIFMLVAKVVQIVVQSILGIKHLR
jgi:hypothetical protein